MARNILRNDAMVGAAHFVLKWQGLTSALSHVVGGEFSLNGS